MFKRSDGLLACTIAAVLVLLSAAGAPAEAGEGPNTFRRDSIWIQEIVDDLKTRLAITRAVRVLVVPKNALMVSVEEDASGFVLSVERDFMEELSDDELRAAVAHELGHVWIFTHHPFLQTEKLANQIAMRVVPRETLVMVYEKVWKRQGTKGDLVRFVGD